MAEWSKAHAWKVCIGAKTSIEGSNPSSSASLRQGYGWPTARVKQEKIEIKKGGYFRKAKAVRRSPKGEGGVVNYTLYPYLASN
jgi:hypothetical protein